eukprot:scaffold25770_cov67-Phaeocystis_antarctica.AAC.2
MDRDGASVLSFTSTLPCGAGAAAWRADAREGARRGAPLEEGHPGTGGGPPAAPGASTGDASSRRRWRPRRGGGHCRKPRPRVDRGASRVSITNKPGFCHHHRIHARTRRRRARRRRAHWRLGGDGTRCSEGDGGRQAAGTGRGERVGAGARRAAALRGLARRDRAAAPCGAQGRERRAALRAQGAGRRAAHRAGRGGAAPPACSKCPGSQRPLRSVRRSRGPPVCSGLPSGPERRALVGAEARLRWCSAVRPHLRIPPPLTLQAAARPAAHDDHVARPELAGRRPTRRRPRLPRICCAGPKRGPTAAEPGPVDATVDATAQPARGAAPHAALPKRPPNPGLRQRGAVAQFVDVAVAELETPVKRAP